MIEVVEIAVLAIWVSMLILPFAMYALGLSGWLSVCIWLAAAALLTRLVLIPSRRAWRVQRWADEGRCQSCGYSLTGLTVRRCPECGSPF